jgi:histidyl-tRNA synthetase
MQNMQNLKGFRDFLPADALKRKYLVDMITGVFQKFGFDPLETPALEHGEVLMGKYGEEALSNGPIFWGLFCYEKKATYKR